MLRKFHFHRFELKYIVPKKYKTFIKQDLLPYMYWDNYARLTKTKRYFVNSLYFDSYDLRSYQEKIDGISNRFKLRLRTYGSDGFKKNKPVFFEIKRKRETTVIKNRGILSFGDFKYLIEDGSNTIFLDLKKVKKRKVFEDFLFLKNKYRMRPILKVSYEREPFEGIYCHNLRITLDSDIQAARIRNFFGQGSNKILLENDFVLEVKFRGLLPFWFYNIIRKYQLERMAFSKYGQAVESVL